MTIKRERPRAWMPIYWGDYIQDTNHLTAAEHGAYLMLIAHYWATGGPIKDEDEQLRRVARMTPREWRRSRTVIRSFFAPESDRLRHTRIDEELKRWAQFIEQKKAAGRQSAATRVERTLNSVTPSVGVPLPTESQRKGNPLPLPSPLPLPEKKDSVANATGNLPIAQDDRTRLFNGSLTELGRLAGKEPNKLRSLVGRWLKLCNDDAGVLVDAIAAASERRVADPVAWIEAGMKARAGPRNGAQDLSNTNLQIFLRSLANV